MKRFCLHIRDSDIDTEILIDWNLYQYGRNS